MTTTTTLPNVNATATTNPYQLPLPYALPPSLTPLDAALECDLKLLGREVPV